MASAVNSIIRKLTRQKDDKLNILLFTTHERYESLICKTDHNFYALNCRKLLWLKKIAPKPENYTEIGGSIPKGINFDLVLTIGRKRHYLESLKLSNRLNLPMVVVEIDKFEPGYENRNGHKNVFLSQSSANSWGFANKEYFEIPNAVDREIFYKNPDLSPRTKVLVNCSMSKTKKEVDILKTLSTKFNIKTFDLHCQAHYHLMAEYLRDSLLYLNLSEKPQSLGMLEAMGCGCCVLSVDTEENSNIIRDGETGFLFKTMSQLETLIEDLYKNQEKALDIGNKSNHLIDSKFKESYFIREWNKVFYQTANQIYLGEPT